MENEEKRFKIKKLEYYEELDEVNQEINKDLHFIGFMAMLITMLNMATSFSFKECGFWWGFVVQSVCLGIEYGITVSFIIDLVQEIMQKKILKEKIEELNDLLNVEESKKMVLSKNGENKGFRR